MCETTMPDRQSFACLDQWAPLGDAKGEPLVKRSLTMAENKRDALMTLWRSDVRVAPWRNTVFGVSQAVTTYGQHMSIVRNVSRVERNKMSMVQGKLAGEETEALATLRKVMAVSA